MGLDFHSNAGSGFRGGGGGRTRRAPPPPKIGKNMILFCSALFFLSAPPLT